MRKLFSHNGGHPAQQLPRAVLFIGSRRSHLTLVVLVETFQPWVRTVSAAFNFLPDDVQPPGIALTNLHQAHATVIDRLAPRESVQAVDLIVEPFLPPRLDLLKLLLDVLLVTDHGARGASV